MKKLLVFALTLAIAFTSLFGSQAAYADTQPGPGGSVSSQTTSLSSYMRGVYKVTKYPDLDEAVYQAFDTFQRNAGNPSYVTVYRGSYDDCVRFRDYFNLYYGYTYDVRTVMIKDQGYAVAFRNTLDADAKAEAYIAEAQKAQAVASSLNTGTQDDTLNNIINWVKANAKYYYSEDTMEGYISHYYGIYSNKEILCEGYAMAVYQLCAMNGIPASIDNLVDPNGVNHAANTVTVSGKTIHVDTTQINSVSDTLWSGYVYFVQ